jgi:hypothetical protein
MTQRDVAVTVQLSAAGARRREITGLDAVLDGGNDRKRSPTVGV